MSLKKRRKLVSILIITKIHEFHKLLASRKSNKKNSFSLFHTNIQSIHNKLDLLNLTLTNFGHLFDVLALSETWIDQNDKKTHIVGNLDGYNKFLSKHGNSLKGGCGFFVKTELQVLERNKLDISFTDSNNEYEAKWIEIINKGKKNIIIGVCYRHPRKKSDESFNQYLEKTLVQLNKKNKLTIVVGDFNYNLLNQEKDKYSAMFLNTMMNNNFQPCILEPTRITANNKPSLIDNIFLNTVEKDVHAGNFTTKLSDHLPQFMFIDDAMPIPTKKNRENGIYQNLPRVTTRMI